MFPPEDAAAEQASAPNMDQVFRPQVDTEQRGLCFREATTAEQVQQWEKCHAYRTGVPV
jgi:hypothetical protein